MGNSSGKGIKWAVFKKMENQTHFTLDELKALHAKFEEHASNQEPAHGIKREQLKQILEEVGVKGLQDPKVIDHLFNIFDTGDTGVVNYNEFVTGLSIFSRGSIAERIQWSWSLYNLGGNDVVTKEEMVTVLLAMRKTVRASVAYSEKKTFKPASDKDIRSYVDKVYKESSSDGDGLTFEEYVAAIEKYPLILAYQSQ